MTYDPGEGPVTEDEAKEAVKALPEGEAPDTAGTDLDNPDETTEDDE